ncbi:MAG TPA: hypothetical protein VFJ58_04520 [Armatimonadota bacterium]|nr:hypothetical protein [Armatimonadota bacterium]
MKRFLAFTAAVFMLGALIGVVRYHARQSAADGPAALPTASSVLGAQYRFLMKRELASYSSVWHNHPYECGYLGGGGSDNRDIRLNSAAALAYAVLVARHPSDAASSSIRTSNTGRGSNTGSGRPDRGNLNGRLSPGAAIAGPADSPRVQNEEVIRGARRRAVMIIRFLASAHRVGGGTAVDGKKWGGTDAAAVDAANIGIAAYLIRSSLDQNTQRAAADVVRFEAERYLFASPATVVSGGSAAVSNAAASEILCVAAALYSSGEARSAYYRRAVTYLSRVFTTYSDVIGAAPPTLFPDLTLQYGGGFSTSAELQVIQALATCALCYHLAGQTPPPELDQHVTDCWRRVLLRLSLTNGWFLTESGDVTSGGAGVSWLAAGLGDPAARAIDADTAARILRSPTLKGAVAITPLTQPRVGEVAYQELIYDYLSLSPHPPLSLTDQNLDVSLRGVTWLRSASLALNRTNSSIVTYSWPAGAGREWLISGGPYLRWRFGPEVDSALPLVPLTDAPVWSQDPTGFTTTGTLRLASGAAVQAAVCSLPDGLVILMERSSPGATHARIAFSDGPTLIEPDLYRDDENGASLPSPQPGIVRWANVGNTAILILDGAIAAEAPPGVSSGDPPRDPWPLLTVVPGENRLIMAAIYPGPGQAQTQGLASASRLIPFLDSGWQGALIPAPDGSDYFVLNRFGGSTSTSASLTAARGAPVTVEEAVITGQTSSVALSSPRGAARWESITCWLTIPGRDAVNARQSEEPNAVMVTNPGDRTELVTARYLSSGRPCVVAAEDQRPIVRLAPRRKFGEVRFYLSPGRTVTVRY